MRTKQSTMMQLLNKGILLLTVIVLSSGIDTGLLVAQDRADLPDFLFNPAYRSSQTNEKKSTTAGNRVNITFFNTGLLGGTGEVRGEWPKGSENFYIGDVAPVIALEVPIDTNGDGVKDSVINHAITTRGPRAGQGPRPGQSEFWGFEPMGGFARDDGENTQPAISTDESTWPVGGWPDEPDWVSPSGETQWNGFFGRGIKNADFESYFWMDDHNDLYMQEDADLQQYNFLPDSTDPSRMGQGLAVKTRVLQWSQFLAQDAAFFIYELTNTSTTTYPRVATGLAVGTLAGGDGDSEDDLAFFDQANRIVYSWDADNSGNRGQEVGYVGYAFMESPGNASDGIDNDGDGDPSALNIDGEPYVQPGTEGVNNIFTPADFQPRTLTEGAPIITIDEETGEREIQYMPSSGSITVTSQGNEYTLSVGDVVAESEITISGQIDDIEVTEKNLIDEDFDGIIDEDLFLHFERRQQDVLGNIVTLPALRFKNYVGFANDVEGRDPTQQDSLNHGLLNLMIDESPYDGIDNDGDWDPLSDDVGEDGISGTGDNGEGDGRPTPGEPNFELLDVDETDQVGLSSFYYFTPAGAVPLNRDQTVWESLTPGFFTTNRELETQQAGGGVDGDFIFGSGYFRLEPGQTLRFSLALVFGEDLQNITNNVQTVQEIYNRNYNFAQPPEKPTLQAAAGDGEVILYWDDVAEQSVDPVLGQDFEGYKIFKSTDPFFLDPDRITDANGNDALLTPIAQFDLDNGIEGLWTPFRDTSNVRDSVNYEVNPNLIERTRGVPFNLGSDSGLEHSYVDTTVTNGQTYYYALVAYDRGSIEFYPAENNFTVTYDERGNIVTDQNVVEVTPNAPVGGYEAGGVNGEISHPDGNATGNVFVQVLDPSKVQEGVEYSLGFNEDGYSAETFYLDKNSDRILDNVEVDGYESAIFDGMRFILNNDNNRFNPDSSGWNNEGMINFLVGQGTISDNSRWRATALNSPYNYEIQFSDDVVDTTVAATIGTGRRAPSLPEQPVRFQIVNTTTNEPVDFALSNNEEEGSLDEDDDLEMIDFADVLYILDIPEDSTNYEVAYTLQLVYEQIQADGDEKPYRPTGSIPDGGDVLSLKTYKSFRSNDTYTFKTKSSAVDNMTAKEQLDRISVVPNPYVSAAKWEDRLPPTISSGRGERRIDFIHLPAEATIRIFNVRGELVRELYHDGRLNDGTVSWDLKTRENLEIAYGVYFYHVEVPELGSKTGKIAIIK